MALIDFGNVLLYGVAPFIGATGMLFYIVGFRYLLFLLGYGAFLKFKDENEIKRDILIVGIGLWLFIGLLPVVIFAVLAVGIKLLIDESPAIQRKLSLLFVLGPFGNVVWMLNFLLIAYAVFFFEKFFPDGLIAAGLLSYIPETYGKVLILFIILLTTLFGVSFANQKKGVSFSIFEIIGFCIPLVFVIVLGTGRYFVLLLLAFLVPIVETLMLMVHPDSVVAAGNHHVANPTSVIERAGSKIGAPLVAVLREMAQAQRDQARAAYMQAKAEKAETSKKGWDAWLHFFSYDALGRVIMLMVPFAAALLFFLWWASSLYTAGIFALFCLAWVQVAKEKKHALRAWFLFNSVVWTIVLGGFIGATEGIGFGVVVGLIFYFLWGVLYDIALRDSETKEAHLMANQLLLLIFLVIAGFIVAPIFGLPVGEIYNQIPGSEDLVYEQLTSQEFLAKIISLPSDYIEEQRAIISGDKYTSEVDTSSSRPVGVQLDFEPVQDGYAFDGKMSLLGRVKGAYLDPALCKERCPAGSADCKACTVTLNCGSPEGRTTDAKDFKSEPEKINLGEGGVLFGTGVDCSFAPIKTTGSIVVDVTATYDFVTKSYMPLYFISQAEFDQAFKQSTNFDITSVKRELITKSDLPTPVAKSSPGPVLVGLESGVAEEQPIVVPSGGTVEPRVSTIGFTIQNFKKDDGKIIEIEKVELYLPKGLTVASCGSSSGEYEVKSGATENDYELKWDLIPKTQVRNIERFETVQCKVKIETPDDLIRGPGITQGRIKVSVFYDYQAKKSIVVRIKTLTGIGDKVN